MEVQTLSPNEIIAISTNLRLLLRSVGITQRGSAQVWTPTVEDIASTVDLIDTSISDTIRMCGHPKHADKQFDVVRETILEMREILLNGESQQEIARRRRLNTSTFHLLVVPVVQTFKKFTHKETLAHSPATTGWVKRYIESFVDFGSRDDGLVALQMVRTLSSSQEYSFRKAFAASK